MSIGTRDRPSDSRRPLAGLSVAAFFLLIALLAGLLLSRVDRTALDQAYALYFTT